MNIYNLFGVFILLTMFISFLVHGGRRDSDASVLEIAKSLGLGGLVSIILMFAFFLMNIQ